MCVEAYNQMINVKNIDAKCAYGAILILATLFEKDLKAKIKIACVKEFSTRITSKN
ncbi:hypothetical protein [Clostridium botulinum]|uniref:hypothetical protein n=1 Tax=Clostridium botulinum TaxID=1491 RepID=UPI001A9131F3|nr:hypothetical protein [Clostridium botulinum]